MGTEIRVPRRDTHVSSHETPMSPLEDRLKMGKVFREGDSPWQAEHERCRRNISRISVQKAAAALGVAEDSLNRLGIGFDTYAYTFPMRDADRNVIGLRKRGYSDLTQKHAAEGSRTGLFIPKGVTPANVQIVDEGETDAAAALTLGFAAIATPSAGACADMVAAFVAKRSNACPCIIGDNDAAGKAGAEKLSEELLAAGIPCRILIPPDPYADLRDWLQRGGLTTEALAKAIEKQPILYPGGWPPGFSMIPNALLRSGLVAEIGPPAFCVFCAIASFRGRDGVCRAEREELARLVGCTVRTINRCTGALEKAGLLRWRRGRTGRANEYIVDFGPCKEARHAYPVLPALDGRKRQKNRA